MVKEIKEGRGRGERDKRRYIRKVGGKEGSEEERKVVRRKARW